jgi:EF-hand domain
MVASKRSAMTRAARPRSGYGRGDVAAAGASGGASSIAATFKLDGQQRISLMELMTRIRSAGIGPDDPRVREMIAGLPDTDGRDGGGLTIEQFTAICEASGG